MRSASPTPAASSCSRPTTEAPAHHGFVTDAAARSAERCQTHSRVRADADAARGRARCRRAAAFPRSSRSKKPSPAASAAAGDASCRSSRTSAQAPSFPPAAARRQRRRHTRASAKKGRSFGRTSCDGDDALRRVLATSSAALELRLSDAHGQRLLRIGRGVCAVRRSFEDRRDRAQERHALAAPGQSDAAPRAHAGRHAQRDRPAESGHRLVSRARAAQVRATGRARSSAASRDSRSTITPTSASGLPRATRSRRSSSTSRARTSRARAKPSAATRS